MIGSNLPPGVDEWDLPGNRPEDAAWDRVYDRLADSGMSAEEAMEMLDNWEATR